MRCRWDLQVLLEKNLKTPSSKSFCFCHVPILEMRNISQNRTEFLAVWLWFCVLFFFLTPFIVCLVYLKLEKDDICVKVLKVEWWVGLKWTDRPAVDMLSKPFQIWMSQRRARRHSGVIPICSHISHFFSSKLGPTFPHSEGSTVWLRTWPNFKKDFKNVGT